MIGKTVSHYKITAKLGQGGMGEVWRAQDTKLGRDVALKMLPESFTADPERLARFEREARVLASLSHSGIASIYGVDDAGGRRVLVMEVAEGETLQERLARGPIPPEETVRLALQIAEALEVAHEKGVVHRDLKPANIKITEEGRVKVLDFGLAKALADDPGASGQDPALSPTLTQAMTGAGMLLGTAGYMSPEQARAKTVDRRTDVWAFGCVLYEMLSGQRTFDGETVTDILGAIVHKQPEMDRLPPATPQRVRRLVERCLRKDPAQRYQSIGDVRIALQEWLESPEPTTQPMVAGGWPARRVVLLAVVSGALGLLAGALIFRAGEPKPEPVRRFVQRLSDRALWTSRGAAAVLSPDGSQLAFVTGGAEFALHLRPLDRLVSTQIAGGSTASSATHQPFFSHDGKWLGYFSFNELKKMLVTGGSPITLAEVDNPRGGSWGENGMIVFAPRSEGALALVPAAGGTVETLTTAEEGSESHRWPQWLPGAKAVLFTSVTIQGHQQIELVEVDSGERRVVHPSGYYARYVPTGHIIFVDGSAAFALPFDVDRLEVTGSPMPVLEGVRAEPQDGEAQFDVSDNGVLVYVPGTDEFEPFPIAWADRQGRTEVLWDQKGIYGTPRLSPDGSRLAVCVLKGENWDVWIYDLGRDVATRLTFDTGYDADPVWSPDGRSVAFTSDRGDKGYGIYRKRSDGTGEVETLLEAGTFNFPSAFSWSPDGRRLAFVTTSEDGSNTDLWFLAADGSGKTDPFLTSSFDESTAYFSPDGRFIAYTSNETGRQEVFVRSLVGEGKWQISSEYSTQPMWSRKGELLYRTREGLVAVKVETRTDEFRAGRPEVLFGDFFGNPDGVRLPGLTFFDYDVASSGERFVVFPRRALDEADSGATVHIVTGWFEELRRLTESVAD